MSARAKSLLVILATVLPLGLPYVPSVAAFKFLQTGMPAPSFQGKDILTGEKISLDERNGIPNETICVAFWATWSPRSLELMADLKTLSARLSDQPFRVIAVNVDSQVTTPQIEERVRAFLQELEPNYAVLIDDGLEIFYSYGVVAVPSMAIIDADGIVRADPSGYSYSVRDRLDGEIELVLGLRTPEDEVAVEEVYEPVPKASRYYYLAVQLANKRLYESALAKLDTATEADPGFSAPHNLRGHINLELGDVETALENFAAAIALDSLSVSAHAGLGRALLENNDVEGARRELTAALDLDAEYPVAMQDLGRCLAAMDEHARAIDVLKGAIELNPRDPELYYHLGRVQYASGSVPEALAAFRTALEMLYP